MPRNKLPKVSSEGFEAKLRHYVKELGRRGGKKRSQNLTPERRRQIARKAALARWSNRKRKKNP